MNNETAYTWDDGIAATLEIEGLLRVCRERSTDAGDVEDIKALIRSKLEMLEEVVAPVAAAAEEKQAEETAAESDDEAIAENVEFEEASDADVYNPDDVVVTETDGAAPVEIRLSVGDRYLFSRELFDGNDAELSETLATVGRMADMEEVKDYLYNDLCFDEFNPTVKAFVAEISKYVKQ